MLKPTKHALVLAALFSASTFAAHFARADDTAPPPQQNGQPGDQQQPRGPRMPPELARALNGLTLTDDQKAQIKKISEAFHKKQQELRDQLLKSLKAVLTDDQYKQVEESFKQPPPPPPGQDGQGGQGGARNQQGGGPDGGGGGPGGGGPGGNGDMPPPPPNQ